MSQQASTDAYEDDRIAAEVHVIRLEMAVLPALRAMDAAWIAYVREDFLSGARRAAGVRYLAAISAYNAAWSAYKAALDAFHAAYPER